MLSDRALDHLRRVARTAFVSSGRYEVLEEIGAGGMGVVHRAVDRALTREVALKVLAPEAASTSASRRMKREARVLASLEHPGIVPIHDVGTLDDGRVWYAMKLVHGRRLDEHVRQIDGLNERLRIFGRLCEAVAFAHAQGVVHRDLKPSNVMVGSYGEVLVMDWGVAKLLASTDGEASTLHAEPEPPVRDGASGAAAGPLGEMDTHTRPGTVLGTPGYMAPEQADGDAGEVDARADVFALGAILDELIAGRAAPRRLRAICDKARSERREDRYPTAAVVADEVGRFLDGERVAAYRESWIERLGRFAHRFRTPILLMAAYLAARALILWLGGT
jgi:serine/threonine protein kinase